MLKARGLAAAALVSGLLAVSLVILTGGNSYTLHLQFLNAGGLVEGGEVQVAGVKVGSITGIGLTPNATADVTISIDNSADIPLHRGTRAAIRQVGAATIANNFIDIHPGPTNEPALPNGATLPPTQTAGIVDLDAVFDSMTPAVRSNLQRLIAESSQVFAGSGSRDFAEMLIELDPALAQVNGLTSQLASDQANLGHLISTATEAATAIASRSTELRSSVGNVARALAMVAEQRGALADVLVRAPSVLAQGGHTIRDLVGALRALRPTLREIPPAAGPAGRFLTLLAPVARETTPVVSNLRAQLPGLEAALAGFPTLKPKAVTGLGAAATALHASNPILRGLRLYSSDFVLGIFNGLFAIPSGNYDKAGHYAHAEFAQSPQLLPGGTLASILPNLSGLSALTPALFGIRTHLVARCPGGANPPAPDGSSPWIPDPSLCNPAEDVPANVDQPFQP